MVFTGNDVRILETVCIRCLHFCSDLTRVPVDYDISLNSLAIRAMRSHRYPIGIPHVSVLPQ
jgi:hypothetical protein